MSWSFVLLKFWYWFLIPIFRNVTPISYFDATKLMIVINLLTYGEFKGDEKFENNDKGILKILDPWITVTLGFIITCLFKL